MSTPAPEVDQRIRPRGQGGVSIMSPRSSALMPDQDGLAEGAPSAVALGSSAGAEPEVGAASAGSLAGSGAIASSSAASDAKPVAISGPTTASAPAPVPSGTTRRRGGGLGSTKDAAAAGGANPATPSSSGYPLRAPYIDAQLAQAVVPECYFDRATRPPSPLHSDTRVVWSGQWTREATEFVGFCRALTSSEPLPAETIPLEEDENVLEFYERANEDPVRARLLLLSSLGGGAETSSVVLSHLREAKRPTRARAYFSRTQAAAAAASTTVSSANGASVASAPPTAAGGEEPTDPSLVLKRWKEWVARCKKTLATPSRLADLEALAEERTSMPRFVPRSGSAEDEGFVTVAHDVLTELENRIKDVEEFCAAVHDALSAIHPLRRFKTTQELKKLADDAPKRVLLKETEVLRRISQECELWEQRAARWISSSTSLQQQNLDLIGGEDAALASAAPAPSAAVAAPPPPPVPSGPAARGAKAAAPSLPEEELTLASLTSLIEEAKTSPADHSASLRVLNRKLEAAKDLTARLRSEVPQEVGTTWRTNAVRKFVELRPLSALRALQEEVRQLGMHIPEARALDFHVGAAEEWMTAVREALAPRAGEELVDKASIKDLVSLAAKTDVIAVDLSLERRALEAHVEKAQAWMKRVRATFVTPMGRSKKLRGAGNEPDEDYVKPSIELLNEFRDEGVALNVSDASYVAETAETVEEWSERARAALRGMSDEHLAEMEDLVREADDIPVNLPEEKVLRAEIVSRNWTKRAMTLLNTTSKSVPLSEYEKLLDAVDVIHRNLLLQMTSGASKSKSSSAALANKRKAAMRALDGEDEVRSRVSAAKRWCELADSLLPEHEEEEEEDSETAEGAEQQQLHAAAATKMSLAALKSLLTDTSYGNVDLASQRASFDKDIKRIAKWQVSARKVLLECGFVPAARLATWVRFDDAAPTRAVITTQDLVVELDPSEHELEVVLEPGKRKKLTWQELRGVSTKAASIGVLTEEGEIIRDAEAAARQWLQKCHVICPPEAYVSSSAASMGDAEAEEAGALSPDASSEGGASRHSKRVSVKTLRKGVIPEIIATAVGTNFSVSSRFSVTEATIVDLLSRGDGVIVDVGTDTMQALTRVLEATQTWRTRAETILREYQARVAQIHPSAVSDPGPKTRRRVVDAPNFLVALGADAAGHADFTEDEPKLSWEGVPPALLQSMSEARAMMLAAGQERLHVLGVDSAAVRACGWLVRALRFYKRGEAFRTRGLEGSSKPALEMVELLELLLEGLRLDVRDEEATANGKLPWDLPPSVLNDFPNVRKLERAAALYAAALPESAADDLFTLKSLHSKDYVSKLGAFLATEEEEEGAREADTEEDDLLNTVMNFVGDCTSKDVEGEQAAELYSWKLNPSSHEEEEDVTSEDGEATDDVEPSAKRVKLSSPSAATAELASSPAAPAGRSSKRHKSSPVLGVVDCPGVAGCVSRRCVALQRVVGAALVWQRQVVMDARRARSDRTMDRLAASLASFSAKVGVPHVFAAIVSELLAVRSELHQAEVWKRKVDRLLANELKLPVEELDKLASYGAEKLQVSLSDVDRLRALSKKAREWLEAVLASGVERGDASVEDLRALLREGLGLTGADVSSATSKLELATRQFCMCRGVKTDRMLLCVDCDTLFHEDCMRGRTVGGMGRLCAVCEAARAVQRVVGLGNSTLVRVLAADRLKARWMATGAYETPEERATVARDFDALVAWCREAVRARGDGPPPPVPARLKLLFEVTVVRGAFKMRALVDPLNRLRDRPTLEMLETFLLKATGSLPPDSIARLADIAQRAKALTQLVQETASVPEGAATAEAIEARMREALEQIESIPLDMDKIKDVASFCAVDGAKRYCTCRGFDDGSRMVQCSGPCGGWFHVRCVAAKLTRERVVGTKAEEEMDDQDFDFVCDGCTTTTAGGPIDEESVPAAKALVIDDVS